jgi:hypothetical protein
MENDYIRFFVEYYKDLHFDKIIIYDNNELDGERFEEVIGDYIKLGFVELVDFRGKAAPQMEAYQDAYDRYNKDYDWLAFFDCDEFLTFVDNTNDIHVFLSRDIYKPFQVIHFNWMDYGDNDMLDNDGRNVIDRFEKPILPYSFKAQGHRIPDNKHVKSIVRGGLYNIKWSNPHSPKSEFYHSCNNIGHSVKIGLYYQDIDYSISYLRHFKTKTIGEWIKCKMRRGDVYFTGEKGRHKGSLDEFFMYNEKTEDKMLYAEKLIHKYNIKR